MKTNPVERRELLIDLWSHGVNNVKGRYSVNAYLTQNEITMNKYSVIAIGKAAADMMLGAIDVLGSRIKNGLVLTKYDHVDSELDQYPQIVCHESAHPVPDQRSLDAGQLLLECIKDIPHDHKVLMLISGGASSLVDVLQEPCQLMHLQQLNTWALHNGLNINEINYMRQQVSLIKAGGLCKYFNSNDVLCLYISDVPNDNLEVIGSGLLYKKQAISDLIIADRKESIDAFLRQTIEMNVSNIHEKALPIKGTFTHHIIANNDVAKNGVINRAKLKNLSAFLMPESIDMDYQLVSTMIVEKVLDNELGIYIWGGEPTVDLPEDPGKGGRNQALALLLSTKLGVDVGVSVLVAGTDGTDGPTDAAGAMIDNNSYEQAKAAGLDPLLALEQANAYPCLKAMNSLFLPGPTGTNVMDLIIVYRY